MAAPADFFMLALCLWREARSEGETGIRAVGCVIRNRSLRTGNSVYKVVTAYRQFSSITAPEDHQLASYPAQTDSQWQLCQKVASDILSAGSQPDLTGGATMYYSDIIPPPRSWNFAKLTQTVKIGHHIFFREE